MNRTSILLFCMMINAASLFAIDLPIGTSTAELALKTQADAGEYFGKGLPLGPAALKFVGESLWVSDSLNKRLVEFDAAGKQIKSINIATASHVYPEDFVLLPDGSFWVCDIDNTALLKIDPSGKILEKLTVIGDKKLAWPVRIELLPSGNLLVLDFTLGELIEFTPGKELVRADAVHGRSFLIADGALNYLIESKDARSEESLMLVSRRLDTGKESNSKIPVADVLDPELLARTAGGEFVIGCKPVKADGSGSVPYYLIRFAIGSELTESMQIGFPEAFLTRPLIADGAGRNFLVRLIQNEKGCLLRLAPIVLNFSIEKSGG